MSFENSLQSSFNGVITDAKYMREGGDNCFMTIKLDYVDDANIYSNFYMMLNEENEEEKEEIEQEKEGKEEKENNIKEINNNNPNTEQPLNQYDNYFALNYYFSYFLLLLREILNN